MSEPTLELSIACDADPDRPRYGGPRYDGRAPLQWRGIEQGLPHARDILNRLQLSHGVRPLITWCVRSDLQVAELHGEAAWEYAQFRDAWRQLEDEGDEIGWHAHLWRWSEERGSWYQEIEDSEWIDRCLSEGYASLAARVRRPVRSTRMGWEFHSNQTMAKIAELGIRADLSGSPGRRMWPDSETDGAWFDRHMDWSTTPDRDYQPALMDYRRPAADGEAALGIWEVPTSSYVPRYLRVAAQTMGIIKRLRKGRLAEAFSLPVLRSALHAPGIAMLPQVVSGAIRRKVMAARRTGSARLVLAFHADELLPPMGDGKQRFYGPQHFERNLVEILEVAHAAGVWVRPMTGAMVAEELRAAELPSVSSDRRAVAG